MKVTDDGSAIQIPGYSVIVSRFTPLSDKAVEKLEAFGNEVELVISFDGYQYHAGGPDRVVSIIKRVNSYGGTENLWECAVLEDDDVRHIEGYLSEEQVLEYAKKWLKHD